MQDYITDITDIPCTLPVKFIYSGSVATLGRKRLACLGFVHSFWGGYFFWWWWAGGGVCRRGRGLCVEILIYKISNFYYIDKQIEIGVIALLVMLVHVISAARLILSISRRFAIAVDNNLLDHDFVFLGGKHNSRKMDII